MPTMTTPAGVRLFYTDDGAEHSNTLLFVHGFACDSHDWDAQIAHFSRTHRVIAPDLRGHGRSSTSPDSSYAPEDNVADLIALLDALSTRPVVAVGHSMGGLLVSMLEIERPDLVASLVLLDPTHGAPADLAPVYTAAADLMAVEGGEEHVAVMLASIEGRYAPDTVATLHRRRALAMDRTALSRTFQGLFAGTDPYGLRGESSDRYFLRRSAPALTISATGHQAARVTPVPWDNLGPRDRQLTVPGGHWIQQEHIVEVAEMLEDWLRDRITP